MATFTYQLGTPALAGYDYNPFFHELVDFRTAVPQGTPSATQLLLSLPNGLKAQVIGTGFTYDAQKDFTGGTVTAIKLLLPNGTTPVMSWTSLSIPAATFSDNADFMNPWQMSEWIARGSDLLNGGNGHDNLFGGLGNDTINGGNGDDYIDGGAGKDTFDGGAGFDELSFSNARDDAAAFRGIDLNAAAGTVIDAYGNAETFKNFEGYRGTQFADKIVGSALDENFMGLGGRDFIDGAGGFDVVRYHRDANAGGTAGVTVDLLNGYAIDGFGRRDTLVNIEGARGTDADDKLIGSAVDNNLRGDGGNDFLDGGAGGDSMRGGAGNDTYVVDNVNDRINESADGNLGNDTVRSSIAFSLASTTQINGTVENLILTGSAAINGTGNTASNAMTGNSAVNTLLGDAGNDLLNGGAGNDILTGGSGLDTFFFNTALNATTNVDRITDFVVADDIIRLENGIFTALTATGALGPDAFAKNLTGLAGDTTDRIIYETDTGKLFYDGDGNGAGAGVHFATVAANLTTLSAADFFVV